MFTLGNLGDLRNLKEFRSRDQTHAAALLFRLRRPQILNSQTLAFLDPAAGRLAKNDGRIFREKLHAKVIPKSQYRLSASRVGRRSGGHTTSVGMQ
jgi:hypothetical protein